MKKIIICIAVFISGFSISSTAQTFQRGSLIVSAAWGIDVYNLQQHLENYATGETTQSTTHVASRNFNLGGEFGVAKWLGLGLQFKLDNYYHDNNVSSAIGFESGLIVNAHIIRHLHFDLLGGFNLGYSTLTLTWNDGYNDQLYGKGSWDDIHFTARIYIGRFGFSGTLYFPVINYGTLTFNNNLLNEYILASWKASGEGWNFGIQYHFLR